VSRAKVAAVDVATGAPEQDAEETLSSLEMPPPSAAAALTAAEVAAAATAAADAATSAVEEESAAIRNDPRPRWTYWQSQRDTRP